MDQEKDARLADELMLELRLDLGNYKDNEIRAELIQCLPELLKLDVTLLDNEIVSLIYKNIERYRRGYN